MNTQPKKKTQIGVGSRVRCNSYFAAAFEGQTGTITEGRPSAINGWLWTVTFDNPTPAATGWEPLKTLAATADYYELIQD